MMKKKLKKEDYGSLKLNEMLQKHFQNKFINMKTDINAFLQNINKMFQSTCYVFHFIHACIFQYFISIT